MLPELKGRGLFVFSDPGGAKPILAYVSLHHFKEVVVVSDRVYDFFSDYDFPVKKYEAGDETKLLDGFKPDFVFTGTSYTSKIELRFINEAKKRNITAISFIDHYTRYPDRFAFEDGFIYPDHIFLTDERAERIALDYSLNKYSSISVTGNFNHQFLKNWKPPVDRSEIFKAHQLNAGTKIITFAPDPLSNVGGKEKFQFDETDVWNAVARSLSELDNKDVIVVVKMHPNQDQQYLKDCIQVSDFKNVVFAEGMHTNSLIYYSDIIIGMYSSFLVEANQFNKQIVRYLPNPDLEDALQGMNIGSICNNVVSLTGKLNKLL